jgi:hypothetical protein
MPKDVYDRGLLRPYEVARLQRVFNKACRAREVVPDSEEGRELALTLLALHNAGMVDEDMLSSAIAYPRQPDARSA